MSKESKSTNGCALVTGGARRLGAAIVRQLHGRGLHVLIHYLHSRDEADQLAQELNEVRSGSAQVLQADLCAAGDAEALAGEVRERGHRLSLLVNNASRFYPTLIGDVDGDTWQDLMGSNVRGAFFLSQALARDLKGGAIVNLVDIHARRPMPRHPVYSMAKAALEMMTQSLALELAPEVRVNGVAPGAILWPEGEEGNQAVQDSILSKVALGRAGHPADIAGAVAFLGLDAPYVTGQILAVDGGRSLNM